jgi:hypothetical protein
MRTVCLGEYRIIFTNNYQKYVIERNVAKRRKGETEVWKEIPYYALTELEQELLNELILEWTTSWIS